MANIIIDQLSACTTPLIQFFGDQQLALGTAFFWLHEDRIFLVTNWHNLSGKDADTGKHLSKTLAEPDRIIFDFFPGQDLNKRSWRRVPILAKDGAPLWLEHRTHRHKVDVVCLPLDLSKDDCLPINTVAVHNDMVEAIGADAFILGYPLGIGPMRYPIWKRCSIASEPQIDAEELPLFYVDTATAPGMSGSPVVLRPGFGPTEDGSWALFAGAASKFIGVYSGRRIGADPATAQLGRVWKARVLSDILPA